MDAGRRCAGESGDGLTAICSRVYRIALRLYPADYHARFAREMHATFREVLIECRHPARFTVGECIGVVIGAVREWLSKLTTDAAVRGRRLPDCRVMRPVGVTPHEWSAGLEWIEQSDDDISHAAH